MRKLTNMKDDTSLFSSILFFKFRSGKKGGITLMLWLRRASSKIIFWHYTVDFTVDEFLREFLRKIEFFSSEDDETKNALCS